MRSDKFDKFNFSIIIGGAIGNFYDRITLNAVPDFIDLHYLEFHWFTFNFADIFVTIGIIAYILRDLILKKWINEKNIYNYVFCSSSFMSKHGGCLLYTSDDDDE